MSMKLLDELSYRASGWIGRFHEETTEDIAMILDPRARDEPLPTLSSTVSD